VLFLSLDTKPLKTMNYIQIPDYVFDDVIRLLQEGVNISQNVDFSSNPETERSLPFANGYNRAIMQDAINRLRLYKEEVN
jgi:hypothetical protein